MDRAGRERQSHGGTPFGKSRREVFTMRSASHLHTRRAVLAGLSLGATALLAACTASPSPTAAPKPASPPAAAPTTAPKPAATADKPAATTAPQPAATQAPAKPANQLRVRFGGTSPAINTVTQNLGFEKGIYRDAGVDLDVQRLNNDIQILQAIVGGQIDVATAGPSAVLGSIESGNDVKILGTDVWKVTFLMFSKKSVADAKDLAGKAIAITAPNALPHVLAKATLITAGVDPNNANYIQLQDPAAAVQALVSGSADATPARMDNLKRIEANSDLKVLVNLTEMLPRFVQQSMFTSEKMLRENPEAVKRYVTGTALTIRHMIRNKADVVPVISKITGTSETDLDWLHDWMVQNRAWSHNAELPSESLAFVQQLSAQVGLIKAPMPTEKVFNGTFQQQVASELPAFNY